MVYVLSGEVTVVEGDVATSLRPGDAATFPAGLAVRHCVENRSSAPCRYLVMGTRADTDIITYPDSGKRCVRLRSLDRDLWIDTSGKPTKSPYRD
ncbi:cupin domain-containing protein [Neoroseomonas terrae]|uniref:cupin domain-containing protein n=1 Tax=Neoroseomonas terrae TaxID=424799 RepID=UPI001BA99519